MVPLDNIQVENVMFFIKLNGILAYRTFTIIQITEKLMIQTHQFRMLQFMLQTHKTMPGNKTLYFILLLIQIHFPFIWY